MKKTLFIVSMITFLGPAAWAKYDPIWSLPDLEQGWSPKQAAEYSSAQMEYAQMARRYGERSQQASQAKEHMLELAQALKAEEREIVPPKPQPGTNGTIAPAEAFDQSVDPIQPVQIQ
jgi:hypothetical protein